MDPLTGAIISGAGSAIQAGMGIADMIRSGRMQKKAQSFFEQNKYDIPESAKAALGIAERQAQTFRLPGQDIMEEQLKTGTAEGVGAAREAASSGGDVLSMLSGLYGSQQGKMRDIGLAASERYSQNQRELQSALGDMARLEDQKWQYNVLYPYQQMLGQAEALGGRGREQLGGAFSGLMDTVGGYQQMTQAQGNFDESMNRMFGPGGAFGTKQTMPTITADQKVLLDNMWKATKGR